MMGRERIDDQNVEKVVGGSIVFTTDHTSCGYNRNDQYRVNDYAKAMEYILAHYKTMKEWEMLKKIAALGYITPKGD